MHAHIVSRHFCDKTDVICLSETWRTEEKPINLPAFLGNYVPTWSRATKSNPSSCGRGAGGLLTLIDKNLQFELIASCDKWILTKVVYNDTPVFICSIYFNKNIDLSVSLEALQALLTNIDDKYVNPFILIGGDFNCRIRNLGDCEKHALDGSIFYHDRVSLDDKERPSANSICLLNFMAENGFVVLNGRSPLDRPGQFTFVDHQGKSTIDFVFVKISCICLISDFYVDASVNSSDHFPIVVQLINTAASQPAGEVPENPTLPRLKWNEKCRDVFVRYLEESVGLLTSLAVSVDELYENLRLAVWEAAKMSGMITGPGKPYIKKDRIVNKPWHDDECYAYRKESIAALKRAKSAEFEGAELEDYLVCRNKYRKEKQRKKDMYDQSIRDSLANTSNVSGFWAAVRSSRVAGFSLGLPVAIWNDFYRSIYPPRILDVSVRMPQGNVWLDGPISAAELASAIVQCKAGKAPGADQISNEFIKVMAENSRLYVLHLFNRILDDEKVPVSWTKIILTMIHKKGNKDDPSNYRGIALVNSFTKLFTSILCRRLNHWAEAVGILPEPQTGFRIKRSCQDNIFSATTVTQLQLRLGGRSLYGLFVDFRRAFDSVPHALLYDKLHKIGISSKFIRILKSLYDIACLQVKSGGYLSNEFDITEGVLQGEMLSPLLFILFIHDIEHFFRVRGLYGPSITGTSDLLMLLFADDLILYAITPVMLRRILLTLKEYCDLNGLTVNIGKTKIVVFRNGGGIRGTKYEYLPDGSRELIGGFLYDGKEVEIVSSYTYLGIPMSSSSLGLQAAFEAVEKARRAAGAILGILVRASADSWDSVLKLYQSILTSTLLYAVPAWGLRYCSLVETAQVRFFKKLLLIPQNTPNALVRLETGVLSLTLQIAKLSLNWVIKVLEMEANRLPRIIFLRMQELDRRGFLEAKFNWLDSLFSIFDGCEFQDLDLRSLRVSADPAAWMNAAPRLLEGLQTRLASLDVLAAREQHFTQLNFPPRSPLSPARYLLQRIPMIYKRVKAQVRMSNSITCTLLLNGKFYNIDPRNLCTICNMHESESVPHVMLRCPMYNSPRWRYLRPFFVSGWEMRDLLAFLDCDSGDSSKALYFFWEAALEIREEIMNIC